jgi:3-oxoacyl-[acyl-carrier protein] reductase
LDLLNHRYKETFEMRIEEKPIPTHLLQDRVVLITGASRGIGAAAARLLAQHGAAVGVNYINNQNAAHQVVQSITASGGKAIAVQADVGNAAQVDRMMTHITETLGTIDTLVLNATAIRNFTSAPISEMTWEQYEDILVGETQAIFIPTKAALPSMMQQQRGCIVAISSGLSHTARPCRAAASSGKAAVDALVRSLAVELGPYGIRVNAIAPWMVQAEGQTFPTPPPQSLNPLGRIASPEDIAGAILMMVSDAAGFITGVYLPVNGGEFML